MSATALSPTAHRLSQHDPTTTDLDDADPDEKPLLLHSQAPPLGFDADGRNRTADQMVAWRPALPLSYTRRVVMMNLGRLQGGMSGGCYCYTKRAWYPLASCTLPHFITTRREPNLI